jgi:hypothetical protein
VILDRGPRDEEALTGASARRLRSTQGIPMVKLFHHSLFSIAFIVVRIFIMDAAASPAHGKHVLQAKHVHAVGPARSSDIFDAVLML